MPAWAALCCTKNDPQQAFTVFQEGLRSDPANVELYTGIDQALSILRRPPQERVAALERYPDHCPNAVPSRLRTHSQSDQSGEFEKADALFHNRFFPREEGGTNVREVWLELQVQRASSFAQNGRCGEAVRTCRSSRRAGTRSAVYEGWTRAIRALRQIQLSDWKFVHDLRRTRKSPKKLQAALNNRIWKPPSVVESIERTTRLSIENAANRTRTTSSSARRTMEKKRMVALQYGDARSRRRK